MVIRKKSWIPLKFTDIFSGNHDFHNDLIYQSLPQTPTLQGFPLVCASPPITQGSKLVAPMNLVPEIRVYTYAKFRWTTTN